MERNLRKRFAEELIHIYETEPNQIFDEVETSKSKFVIDTIRTFLKFEDNLAALQLLNHIEDVIRKHVDVDQHHAISLAVGTLLTTKKEKFKNTNDARIKQVFGNCPYNTIQELVEDAGKLKMQLSDDCLTHVFKNKMKLQRDLWENHSFKFKKLDKTKIEKVPEYFHFQKENFEAEKEEVNKTSTFTMSYDDACVNNATGKALLLMLYEKFHTNLSLFTSDEFAEKMQQSLKSSKSNAELQNDLFEILGFEAFELISQLLDDRDNIIEVEVEKEYKPAGIFTFVTDFLKKPKKNL